MHTNEAETISASFYFILVSMNIETQNRLYQKPLPQYLLDLYQTPLIRRISGIDMNCGVNYTSFPMFADLEPYSRGEHSLGCARLALHFSLSPSAVIACLFHDCATPVFSHSVDFLHGDYMKQESTEERTYAMIHNDPAVQRILRQLSISVDDVADYHRYPLADNPSPHLSCDRLEYTLGNMLNYGFSDFDTVQMILSDLTVSETGDELVFRNREPAVAFAYHALECSRVYTADADRYAMEYLAHLLRQAIDAHILTEDDFYCLNEAQAIAVIEHSTLSSLWHHFTNLKYISRRDTPAEEYYKINAKHRFIDPMILGQGRVSTVDPDYCSQLNDYLAETYDYYIKGEES